jgi:NAD-dependent DNA ligase (contains BRCT domain type II)
MKFTAVQKRAMKLDPLSFAKSLQRSELKAVLTELDERYRKGEEVIGDEHYDIMDDYYWSTMRDKKSTKKVGGVKNADVRLEVPMASLDKFRTLSAAKQNAFMKGTGFVLGDKEDGISCGLTYDNGVPIQATTRGEEGIDGKDISQLIPYLKIPKKIPFKGRFIVRGELTMDKTVFQRIFNGVYKTSRGLGAGLVTRLDDHAVAKHFRFVVYEVQKGKTANGPILDQLELLARYKFDVVPYKYVDEINESKLIDYHDERKAKAGRDIDGIVVVKNIPYKATAGYPTHAYAFKINSLASSVLIPVKDVVWEESRLGRITPRVEIEPTIIGGVEVSFFTGHNNFFIEHGYKQEVAHNPPYKPRPLNKGAMIRAVRSGDVIPFIMEVVKGAKVAAKPDIPYERRGVFLYAVHEGKSDVRVVKELTHFFTSLKTDGMQRGTVTKLVDAGYDTVKKIVAMSVDDWRTLPGFANKSADTAYANVQSCKARMTFANVAVGSAAFGEAIGAKRLDALIEAVPDLLEKIDLPQAGLVDIISDVRGFNKLALQIAKNLKKFAKFCKRNGIKLVQQKKAKVTGKSMFGQMVLFTSVRDKQLEEWIIANGGKLASTVKQATVLVVKDENSSNKKTEEAEQLGKPVLTLANFRKKHGI